MSVLTLSSKKASKEDWIENSPWTITLSEASYIAKGCQISITEEGGNLEAEILAKDGTSETGDEMVLLATHTAHFLPETGYLSLSGTTTEVTVSQQGTCWPSGSPYNLAFVLFFFEDGEGKIYPQAASLSFIGDPEDGGVMAAEAGSGGTPDDEDVPS